MDRSHSPVILLLAIYFSSCSSPVTYVKPREWSADSTRLSLIRSATAVLTGRRIFLDPGHGGDDRRNRGPSGEAIEADVNLRVGIALRDYLRGAGATVLMSRDRDTSVELRDRVKMGVEAGAEIFISLHHNATPADDNVTNYSTVYYHAREGVSGYHPSNHDLARYIERDMSYAMRNPSPPFSTTFDGTLSDFDVYPNGGFGVLRDNPIPAVLIEASFFTYPPEERRLALEEFNTIEAWGMFIGISRYFRAGVPGIVMRSDTDVAGARPTVRLGLEPSRGLDPSSFQLYLDGQLQHGGIVIRDSAVVWNPTADLASGAHLLSGVIRNNAGNHSWPFRRYLNIMLPAAQITVALHPAALPAALPVPLRVVVGARDVQDRPVADRTPLHVTLQGGVDTLLAAKEGGAFVTLVTSASQETVHVSASAGSAIARVAVARTSTIRTCIAGSISAAPSTHKAYGVSQTTIPPLPLTGRSREASWKAEPPLAGAVAGLRRGTAGEPDSTLPAILASDTTCPDGRFVLCDSAGGIDRLSIRASGFFSRLDSLRPDEHDLHHDVVLEPVAGGILFGKTYVFDARYGGSSGPGGLSGAQVNYLVARRAAGLLSQAGARALLMRTDTADIPEQERIRRSTLLPPGRYIRIDAAEPALRVRGTVYPNSSNLAFAARLVTSLGRWTGLDTAGVAGSADSFYRDVAMSTTGLLLPDVATGFYKPLERAVDALAWGIFAGILASEGGGDSVTAVRTAAGAGHRPVPYARIAINRTFTQTADERGEAVFPPISTAPVFTTEGDSTVVSREGSRP